MYVCLNGRAGVCGQASECVHACASACVCVRARVYACTCVPGDPSAVFAEQVLLGPVGNLAFMPATDL